jgi:DNA-binding response OmpR family regulator
MAGKNQKILIVDDDMDLIRAVSAILTKNDYAVISAPNSVSGFELAKTESPDLIIIDIIMDTFSEGFNFINQLIKEPDTKNIPRVILSTLGIQQQLDMVYAEELGALEVLKKPVSADILVNTVKSAIRSR